MVEALQITEQMIDIFFPSLPVQYFLYVPPDSSMHFYVNILL